MFKINQVSNILKNKFFKGKKNITITLCKWFNVLIFINEHSFLSFALCVQDQFLFVTPRIKMSKIR